jgi:copper chaperone CopZ
MITRTAALMGALIYFGASAGALEARGPGLDDGRESAPSDTARVELAISGMTCGSCATTARIALERAPGVYDAEVSYDSASAVVLYDPEKTSPEKFVAYLEKMTGYKARVVEPADKVKGTP